MNNEKLIKRCRERLQGEEEPDWQEWTEMIESLCNALEQTETELKQLNMGKSVVKDQEGKISGLQG